MPDSAERAAESHTPDTSTPGKDESRAVCLALQGGGSHGAFTWGVLDRLLEDERIAIEGISATSAGAVNAVVAASGLLMNGRDGARQALRVLWRRIAHAGSFGFLQPTPLERLLGPQRPRVSPAYHLFDLVTRMFSPYEPNPMRYHPLEPILRDLVDFERLRRSSPVRLYVAATEVRSGKLRIFGTAEIDVATVLAGACLPNLFPAVEIGGEAYWDGGYLGNPAIFPLIYNCRSPDIVIVQVNPIRRRSVPRTAAEILDRMNEISFNSSLMRELRAIAFVTRLLDEGRIVDGSLRRVHLHAIADEERMQTLDAASKLDTDWEFLWWLHEVGREAADAWLATRFDRLGKASTIDFSLFT